MSGRRRAGSVLSSGGAWIHYEAWEAAPARRVLAIVPGLGEHAGRYAAVGAWLAARGTSVWALDLRGMGRSDGERGQLARWRDWLDDVHRVWTLVQDQAPGLEIVPLGHSLGGVVVASAVLEGVVEPPRVVLSNPAFRVRMQVPAWKRALGRAAARLTPRMTLPSGIDPRLLARDPGVGEEYCADPLVHDRISASLYEAWMQTAAQVLHRAADLRVPYLLLLSPQDPIIDPRGSEAFDGASSVGQVVRRYPQSWHEPLQDFDREEVLADLLAWLESAPSTGLTGDDAEPRDTEVERPAPAHRR